LEYWKIVALVGAVIFGVSVFLPVYSALGFSRSLLDEYQDLGSIDWGSAFSSYPASAVGLLLLAILWPIALVLCIVSIFKHRIALAAGVVGIICWIGAIMYIMGGPTSGLVQYGAGIFRICRSHNPARRLLHQTQTSHVTSFAATSCTATAASTVKITRPMLHLPFSFLACISY